MKKLVIFLLTCIFALSASVCAFAADKHKVSFNTGIDGFTVETVEFEEGAVITAGDPGKEGYRFEGWYTDEAKTQKLSSETKMGTADMTLYGKFTKLYELRYSTEPSYLKTIDTQWYAAGETVKLPDLTKDGWVVDYISWYTGVKYVDGAEMPASNGGLRVHYKEASAEKTYNLTIYVVKDGKVDEKTETKAFKENDAISIKETSIDGFTFGGFFSDKEMTQKFELTKMPAKDTAVYAKYTTSGAAEKSYKLSVVTVKDGKTDKTEIKEFKEGSVVTLKESAIDGYTFSGFYTDKEMTQKADITKMPAKDVTVYAKYVVKSATHTHEFEEKTVNATCTAAGSVKKVCKTCGAEELVKTIPATGHKYKFTVDKNEHYGTCSVCGAKLEKEAHKDANGDKKCDVCEYTITSGGDVTVKPGSDNATDKAADNGTTVPTATGSDSGIPKTGSSTTASILAILTLVTGAAAAITVYSKKEHD